jgi:2-keto-4-pentenoate hydratase/2-oxohepta-3-ene-1,7-dioic acid hydratase in catechol pathway
VRIVRYEDRSGDIHHAAERPDGSFFEIEGELFGVRTITRKPAEIRRLLAPLVPAMIWCIGQNYKQHADELGMSISEYPVVFAKGTSALQNPDEPILLPATAKTAEVDYEAELVVIIGRDCKDVPRERAIEYIAGYTCGNDVSARDWQLKKGGGQWSRGKSFDTFAPLGPCLVTPDSLPDPGALRIRTTLNGDIVQDSNTRDMIRGVPELIEFLSQSTTLLRGTAIFTGTPHGVGMGKKPPRWLRAGDVVQVTIDKIGTLNNPVSG